MKQVYMKATELKISVLSSIFNFQSIYDTLGPHLCYEINVFDEKVSFCYQKVILGENKKKGIKFGRGVRGAEPPGN